MTKNTSILLSIIAIIILGLSIGFAGQQIRGGLQEFRSFDRSAVMKGLAERDVVADLAVWPVAYTETENDLTVLQDKMDSHGKALIAFFKKHNITEDEISLQQVQVQDKLAQSYSQNTSAGRYILTQSYLVRTEKIEAVLTAAKNMGDLIRKGIVFAQNGQNAPTYLYTKLNEVKPDMIAKATQNAREGAKQFANSSGQEVGGIKRASQGVFQILPRDKTYAIPESQQKNKTVRVVSTIEFYLED